MWASTERGRFSLATLARLGSRAVSAILLGASGCGPLVLELDGPEVGACGMVPFADSAATVRAGLDTVDACAGWGALTDGVAYRTVQEAIDAAQEHGVVLVCPGERSGDVRIVGRHLQLSSASGSAGSTTLVADEGAALTIEESVVTLSDLGVRGGDQKRAGAIDVSGSSLRVVRSIVRDGISDRGTGGAISITGGPALEVEATSFLGSQAHNGGAIGATDVGCVEVVDASFSGNRADYAGGAIAIEGNREPTHLVVRRSAFSGNYADYSGGAIDLGGWTDGVLEVSGDSVFVGNGTGYGGGAIHAGSYAFVAITLDAVTFEANAAGYEGGAVSVGSHGTSDLTIRGSAFWNNSADHGGAVQIGGWGNDALLVEDSSFVSNAAAAEGGAFAVGGWGNQTASFARVDLQDNQAAAGAALSLAGTPSARVDAEIVAGTLEGNAADAGGAIAHTDGTLTASRVAFGPRENTPGDLSTACGDRDAPARGSFTCDDGSWSVP